MSSFCCSRGCPSLNELLSVSPVCHSRGCSPRGRVTDSVTSAGSFRRLCRLKTANVYIRAAGTNNRTRGPRCGLAARHLTAKDRHATHSTRGCGRGRANRGIGFGWKTCALFSCFLFGGTDGLVYVRVSVRWAMGIILLAGWISRKVNEMYLWQHFEICKVILWQVISKKKSLPLDLIWSRSHPGENVLSKKSS